MTERPQTEAQLIELLRSSDERAPQELHGRIESMIAEHSSPRGRRRIAEGSATSFGAGSARRLGALATLAAVTAAVLAIVLAGGGGSGLTLREATALTLSPAKGPAPAESARHRSELAAAVQGVHFPYWEEHFGWRSTGQRSDRVAGRTVTTVFYANRRGQRIGYAIVAGTPAPQMSGGEMSWHGTTAYRQLVSQGTRVVTWLRAGRLCVLSGRGVGAATLLALARWGDDRGSPA
jgi:hypothetical protein